MTVALIVVDLQNDYFENGKHPLDNIDVAVKNAYRLLSAFRERKSPVFHVQHIVDSEQAPFFQKDTWGAEIHEMVKPTGDEHLIVKETVNSYLNTSLLQRLTTANIKGVIICGAMSHMCIDAIARASADYGFRTQVIQDACATKALKFNDVLVDAQSVHATMMAALEAGYAEVLSTDAVLNAL